MNTGLLCRPWSCHRPRVRGFRPIISGLVERVSYSRRTGWRWTVKVDDTAMAHGYHGTKRAAESKLEGMLNAYTESHYESK